jgi:kanamycin nucleotidyltransferase
MYEFIGKVRNIRSRGPRTHLPFMAVKTAEYGAMLIGLHHRKLFSTGAMVLPEALELSDRPAGFDRLAQMVMSGELTDPEAIVSACEAFWNGLMEWADRHGYAFDTVRIPF